VRLRFRPRSQGRRDLQVVYIDDQGAVTALPTTLVVIDGQKYLEFQTMQLLERTPSSRPRKCALPNTANTDDSGWALLAIIAACGAAIS
jgi:hypothetical protein